MSHKGLSDGCATPLPQSKDPRVVAVAGIGLYSFSMAGKTNAAGLLLLLGLLGCHQDEPEAIERAKQEHYHAKQLFTDRASLLYAQQELDLAEAKASAARSARSPTDETAEQAANNHLEQARLQLKLDMDDAQRDEDVEKGKSFARTLTRQQSHEGNFEHVK